MQVSILLGYLQEVSQTGGSFKIRGIAHTMQVSMPLGYLQEMINQLQKGNFSTVLCFQTYLQGE
jgi:hypothetical protein